MNDTVMHSANAGATEARLKHFPLSFFSMTMGMAGLCIAWDKALHILHVQTPVPYILTGVTLIIFVLLACLHILRVIRYPEAVLADLSHPIKINFLATIPISLLLLSAAMQPLNMGIALVFWAIGGLLQLIVLLYILDKWMHHEHFKVEHLNPAWFIPAVGNVLVPLSGVALGYSEISWFFFSVGMLFWLILQTIIFNRILFHSPLPGKLLPTLFILIAPPSVGFVAFVKLTGNFDAFAHMLYYIALFFTLLLFTQFHRFIRLPFQLSSWAYSFPLASITVASLLMYELTSKGFYQQLALALLALSSLVVIALLVKTVQAIRAGEICIPD